MSNNYTMRDYVREFPVADFFYKLYITKKPEFKRANSIKIAEWILKHGAGALYLKEIQAEALFVHHSTRFFPFSHFFLSSKAHYKNTEIRKLSAVFEEISLEAFPLLIMASSHNGSFSEVHGHFMTRVKDFDVALQVTQELIQEYFPGVFVREYYNGRISIIIPHDIYPKIIKFNLNKIKKSSLDRLLEKGF